MADISQRKLFAEELKRLNQDVTKGDRDAALINTRVKGLSTISRYLNGNVKDNDTAAELITFFRQRILTRSQVLA
jgi:hypothetical protein